MRTIWSVAAMLCLTVAPVAAQDHAEHAKESSTAAGRPTRILPVAEQVAEAVVAAPTEFRAGARVLGYAEAGKLVEIRKGTNDMVCLADDPAESPRWHVACYHAALEPFMARGRELLAQGVTGARRDSLRNGDIVAGRVKMPAAGVVYTVTGRTGCFEPTKGTLCERAEPLHSVYVSFATPATTGLLDHPTDDHTPWLMSPGTPRAHIMFGKHEHH